MMKRRRCSRYSFLVYTYLFLSTGYLSLSKGDDDVPKAADGIAPCEKLKASLTYKQENAPRDISAVLRVLVEKVNSALENVIDVEINWTGKDIHRVVGQHLIQATVTRQIESQTVTQCYSVPFTIQDTDECHLPSHHPMRHVCPEPSLCVNTIGSYECVCPRTAGSTSATPPSLGKEQYFQSLLSTASEWERSLPSSSQCPSLPSTYNCCPFSAHSPGGSSCRATFYCPPDPCHTHDCVAGSQCTPHHPAAIPPHSCTCPAGLLGNGHRCRSSDPTPRPKITAGGGPTEDTARDLPHMCGCTRPELDVCAGFPPCAGKNEVCRANDRGAPQCVCAEGYISIHPFGCVDETPPTLSLKCDPEKTGVMVLRQGDIYKECAVDVIDENAEEYMRNLKIRYSAPRPPGCLSSVGEFTVNYTVATPWTSPPFAEAVRRVVVQDLDECSVPEEEYALLQKRGCGMLIPRCDVEQGATCVNTVGSYRCQCPKGTEGDGFLKLDGEVGGNGIPLGYAGGNGCRDVSVPVIELQGPNPKVFKVAKNDGLIGVLGKGLDRDDGEELEKRRAKYEADIKHMIKTTKGAELCATPSNALSVKSICHSATDTTFRGIVDLTTRVHISDPQPIAPPAGEISTNSLWWRVAYDVVDDAGNHAITEYRHIQVQELSLPDLRNEFRKEGREMVMSAGTPPAAQSSGRVAVGDKGCPPCPPPPPCPSHPEPVTCPDTCAVSEHPDRMMPTPGTNPPVACPPSSSSSSSMVVELLNLIKVTILSVTNVVPTLISIIGVCAAVGFILFILVKIFLSEKKRHDDEEYDRLLANSVTYVSSSRSSPGAAWSPAPSGNGTPRPAPGSGLVMGPSSVGASPHNVTPGGSGSGERGRMAGAGFASPPPTASFVTGSEGLYGANWTPITPARSDAVRQNGNEGYQPMY